MAISLLRAFIKHSSSTIKLIMNDKDKIKNKLNDMISAKEIHEINT
jgi:hypothetical protein